MFSQCDFYFHESFSSQVLLHITLTQQSSYLGIYGPTFLDHWVEARRHGLVLPVRRARCAGRPGTAVVGRVRHGSRERASY